MFRQHSKFNSERSDDLCVESKYWFNGNGNHTYINDDHHLYSDRYYCLVYEYSGSHSNGKSFTNSRC